MNLAELTPGLPPPEPPSPAPLLPLAVGLIAGIAADSMWSMPTWSAVGLAIGGAGVFLTRRRYAASRCLGLILAAAGLGSLRYALADRRLPPNHVVFYTDQRPMLTKLTGRVISVPYVTEPRSDIPSAYSLGPKSRFVLEARWIAGQANPIAVVGKVAVGIRGRLPTLEPGDEVEMTGWLYRPRGPQNPGQYDWAAYKRRDGLLVGVSCDRAESVVVLGRSGGRWQRCLERVRGRLRGYLLDDAFEHDDPGAGVISAMVLAARSAVPQAMNEAFIRTGNAHFLAASGMNVAWLATTVWLLMRVLGVYYRTAAVVIGLVILSYVLLAEPQPSIMRAGIMGLLWCVAVRLRGRANVLNWLACSAIVILLINPTDCLRPAFQYSFLAVLALVHLCPRLSAYIASAIGRTSRPQYGWFFNQKAYYLSLLNRGGQPPAGPLGRAKMAGYWLVQLFALSFSAWSITAPLSCYVFDQFTPWGALQTFLLWFIAAPVTCWGYLTLMLGLLFPSSGAICGPILKIGTNLMVGMVHLLERMPGTILDGRSPSIWWLLAVYSALAMWLYRPHWVRRPHTLRVVGLILLLWWLVPPRWLTADRRGLVAWILAVGDGSGVVVELPNGKVLLCDFGTRSPFDAGQVGAQFLKHRGIQELDAVFVSHPDFDHLSGLEGLARSFHIKKIVVNDHFERLAPEKTAGWYFLRAMHESGIPVEHSRGHRLFEDLGDVRVEAIWPPPLTDLPGLAPNDASTVLRVSYQGRSILLPGDIAEAATMHLLQTGDLKTDVLLLPHHGGVFRNTAQLISTVAPETIVRSSGEQTAMGSGAIEALVSGKRYFNTADVGCVRIVVRDGLLSAAPANALAQ
jgi:competence protein ComEC